MCGCQQDQLCDACVDGRFMQLRGVAACRGERWADDVAAKAEPAFRVMPWPTDSDALLAIARVHVVHDLTRDARLLELLAREATKWAARRWDVNARRTSAVAP